MISSAASPKVNVHQEVDDEESIKNSGSWSYQQRLLYAVFLDQNKATMISKKKRKTERVFDKMAEFVGTRDSMQCRSHHQKVLDKFISIKQILNHFKRAINAEDYKREYENRLDQKQKKDNSLKMKKIQGTNLDKKSFQEVDMAHNTKTQSLQQVKIVYDYSKGNITGRDVNENQGNCQYIINQTNQFGILNMPVPYYQYYFDGQTNGSYMPMGIYYIFQQPTLSLF